MSEQTERQDLSALPLILTAEEAAELLRVTVGIINTWARKRKLPGAFELPGGREWRFKRDPLLDWIENGGARQDPEDDRPQVLLRRGCPRCGSNRKR